MKLMRLGEPGRERPVVRIDETRYLEVDELAGDFDEAFFGSGGLELLAAAARNTQLGRVREFDPRERIGAPIARPHQIICVGLNYSDHAAETGQAIPEEPILFTKSPNTLVGPNDAIRVPPGSTKLDWEVELGVVIGASAYDLGLDEAAEVIAGYTVVNDVSERSFQLERGGQWLKGKSCPTFNPAGPWLVTADEVPDPSALSMRLSVNGVIRQRGNTASMIFDPCYLVSYISRFLRLEPGDLINTGTPPGVGMGYSPPIWLEEGDVIDLSIDGLGHQQQQVVGTDRPHGRR